MKRILILMFIAGIFLMTVNGIDFPQIDGWNPASSVKTYHMDTIHEIVTGSIDRLSAFGFQELKCQDIEQGEMMLSVQIFNMGTALNAYGVFNRECGKNATRLPLSEGLVAAYSSLQGSLCKGQFYLKIIPVHGDMEKSMAISVLKSLAVELHGDNAPPQQFSLLPEKNRRMHSEGFTAENFLGIKELRNCIHAEYQESGDSYQLFRIEDNGLVKAEEVWDAITKSWNTDKSGILYHEIPGQGLAGLKRAEQAFIGTAHCKNLAELKSRLNEII